MRWPRSKHRGNEAEQFRRKLEQTLDAGCDCKLLDNNAMPFRYGNVYELVYRDVHPCLVAGVDRDQIDLLIALGTCFDPPLSLLWILTMSEQDDFPRGRYFIEPSFEIAEIAGFLGEHQKFFELDGRSAVWIGDTEGSLVVYDQHNLIHCYGNTDEFRPVLDRFGVRRGELPGIGPHAHVYKRDMDNVVDIIARTYPWAWSELHEDDDA
ncbi:MAG: hypothetical protein AAGB48_01140 [Planctomycetota bacterium]